jgi:metallophosphoesterase superfamily enzyme
MHRLGVVADIHWCADHERNEAWHGRFDFDNVADRLRESLLHFAETGVEAVAFLGDLAHDRDDASSEAVRAMCAEYWAGPMLMVAGNHDLVDELPDVGDVRVTMPVAKLSGGNLSAQGPLLVLSFYPLISQEQLFAARGIR